MDKQPLPNEYLPESYRTGEVQPPKSHRGLITFLLLLVIFLGGLISGLSFAGIHLFRLLQDTDDAPVLFIEDVQLSSVSDSAGYIHIDSLGAEGRLLTTFDQAYFDFPQGIYITKNHNSDLQIGDILLGINGQAVTGQDILDALLQNHPRGIITLEIYREGKRQTISANLEHTEKP